jgi:hypothetical protein
VKLHNVATTADRPACRSWARAQPSGTGSSAIILLIINNNNNIKMDLSEIICDDMD